MPFASGTLVYVANRNLEVQVTRRDGTVVVTPRGEVDLLTVSHLEDALRTATRVRRARCRRRTRRSCIVTAHPWRLDRGIGVSVPRCIDPADRCFAGVRTA